MATVLEYTGQESSFAIDFDPVIFMTRLAAELPLADQLLELVVIYVLYCLSMFIYLYLWMILSPCENS